MAVAAPAAEEACTVAGVGALAPVERGLEVVRAERAELRGGDRLLQLNGRRLATCQDVSDALRDAQQQSMLAVVALDRDGTVQTVLLSLPRPTAPAAGPTPPPPVPPATPVAAMHTPTVRLLRSNPAALVPMANALRAFGDEIRLPLPGPQPYLRRFAALQATYREARARDEAVAAVDPIMSYYEAVATFVSHRERTAIDRVTRDGATSPGELARVHLPAPVMEYTTASDAGEWLNRYPFLEPSIERKPGWMGQAEYAGLYKPDEAIRLLVERARRETAALQ